MGSCSNLGKHDRRLAYLSSGTGKGEKQFWRCPQQDLVIATIEFSQGDFRVIEGVYVFQLRYAKCLLVHLDTPWCELKARF